MTEEFNAEQARANSKLAKSDYLEIYEQILDSIKHNSYKGINPVHMSFSTATITHENIEEIKNKLSKLGFKPEIEKSSPSSISVIVSY